MIAASSNDAGSGRMPSSGAGGTSESRLEQKLTCPLLSMGLMSGVGKNRHLPCLADECAWWNSTAKHCAVVAGYER